MHPNLKPANPNFSSGPCAKRPGYDVSKLDLSVLGRSHRAPIGKKALKSACLDTAKILGLPEGYRVAVVPASDTGAMEMAMWSMLGERPVDVLYWESFGQGWATDIIQQLKLENTRVLNADYGQLPDFTEVNCDHDVVFTWNGTTSGAKVPNADWIDSNRKGLTFCDATSAVFAQKMDWVKLDVITYSWQKVLGGEGGHGMLILSPRAVQRLESYAPPRPLPKIFRMTKAGKLIEDLFSGATINTPSMLCVVDYLDALNWVESLGGEAATIAIADQNLTTIETFVEQFDWVDFLTQDSKIRSNTSVCLTLNLTPKQIKSVLKLLEEHQVAYDIGAYRDAPAGLRIWCGATIENSDLEALMPWLEWAYHSVKKQIL
ncbi:phosphoserine transaminase [Paraglaciecola sp. MB-3u-78]|uniref:phosphoserine transaminase n=1 Tax=Paraglaciecola sp. MB-3u-78 TaxID=2058332 RepID=UPI000C32F034|nr:phosphoserine transaminase [Paraglaciecola sp. MB-3u-78]PKG93269.1 phosphoserine transaminase [Paraglaciecola sp. MB-3u-78]